MMPSRYSWDARKLQYRDAASGRFVRREAVIRAAVETVDSAQKAARAVAERLVAGDINLAEFQIQMRGLIRAQHTLAAGLALGGKRQLSPAALGRIGAQTREQYKYLRRFALDIQNGSQPLDGRLVARAGMYASVSYSTFAEAERRQKRDAGYTEERNVTHALESCPECKAESDKGWVAAGEISKVGSRQCLVNCRCVIQSRKAA